MAHNICIRSILSRFIHGECRQIIEVSFCIEYFWRICYARQKLIPSITLTFQFNSAQIQGSKNQAEEGTLIILAAGERSLFEECQTCFEAMGKNSFYLGDVGNASKMNLVLQMMAGVTMATLAEGLSLGNKHFSYTMEYLIQ